MAVECDDEGAVRSSGIAHRANLRCDERYADEQVRRRVQRDRDGPEPVARAEVEDKSVTLSALEWGIWVVRPLPAHGAIEWLQRTG